jgi:S1-C subfamily serine protease
VTVSFQGGATRSAKVLGQDRSTDVAVLQVGPSGLTLHPLTLGSSRSLAVGDAVAAIGDPFGYRRSLSTGVVAGLDRTIRAPNGFTIAHAIQTDAPLNPGNSGGPLLGAQGQVIGIADQIATDGASATGPGGNSGVGFAVPIDVARSVLPALERNQAVAHAYLGVGAAPAPGTQAGALVEAVSSGSPAAKAGVRTGDVITAVDGTALSQVDDLINAVSAHKPGDTIALTLRHGSQQRTVSVSLGTRPTRAPSG